MVNGHYFGGVHQACARSFPFRFNHLVEVCLVHKDALHVIYISIGETQRRIWRVYRLRLVFNESFKKSFGRVFDWNIRALNEIREIIA